MVTVDGFRNFNGHQVFFSEGLEGNLPARTLWSTDGSAAGTRSHGRLLVGPGQRPLAQAVASGHRLFFVHRDPLAGVELFALENEAPIATADSGGTVEAGRTLQISVTGNDNDLDGSIAVLDRPDRASAEPRFGQRRGRRHDHRLPRINESGGDSLEYVVADDQGRESNRATVNVSVSRSTAPPPPSGGSGGGGGGTIGVLDLLWRRRLRRGEAATHVADARSTLTLPTGHERQAGCSTSILPLIAMEPVFRVIRELAEASFQLGGVIRIGRNARAHHGRLDSLSLKIIVPPVNGSLSSNAHATQWIRRRGMGAMSNRKVSEWREPPAISRRSRAP